MTAPGKSAAQAAVGAVFGLLLAASSAQAAEGVKIPGQDWSFDGPFGTFDDAQLQRGLQVYREGYWHDIASIPGAIVVNTGDMMQVWSNDRYKAAIHRVLAMEKTDRYSIPFFFNPSASAVVSPLEAVFEVGESARYRAISWAEFRGRRTEDDYADYGEEVQIAQYRVAEPNGS